MIRKQTILPIAAIALTLSLGACKQEETPPPVATPAPAPAATVAPMPAAAPVPTPTPTATASVVSLELGSALSADGKLSTPDGGTFGPRDTIIAVVGTQTSDPAATVQGKLSAKWTSEDGKTNIEDSKDVALTGNGTTDFQLSDHNGLSKGKYKVEISLDGNALQSKDFEVK